MDNDPTVSHHSSSEPSESAFNSKVSRTHIKHNLNYDEIIAIGDNVEWENYYNDSECDRISSQKSCPWTSTESNTDVSRFHWMKL